MILKVGDVLKSFSRTDPESEALRDLMVLFPDALHRKIKRTLLILRSSAAE